MFTLTKYLSPKKQQPTQFKKDVALNVQSTYPIDCDTIMSKPISRVFEWPTSEFLPNETYFIGAMYTSSYYGGTINYGSPSVSETPLFVPASEIIDLKPGDEIHCSIYNCLR